MKIELELNDVTVSKILGVRTKALQMMDVRSIDIKEGKLFGGKIVITVEFDGRENRNDSKDSKEDEND